MPVTDARMTRFWITLDQAVALVLTAFREMKGGEIFVPKIPSMKVTDLARAINPECEIEVIGIRPGEKLHEEMISETDARRTVDMGAHYVIQPEFDWFDASLGEPLEEGFSYSSEINDDWLDVPRLRAMLDD
jgi:UDP-N-acetylglucosamine 4,6-dehydratase